MKELQGRCRTLLVGSDLERSHRAGRTERGEGHGDQGHRRRTAEGDASTEEVEEQTQDAQASEDLKERQEKLSDDVDSVLDEIDDVLEENAEDFVRSFVQKGGE